jgi:hypothetical protein
MRDVAKVLSLTAALLVVGCGSDDQNFNYGWYNPGGGGNPGVVAPVAVADSFSVLSGGTLTGSVTANDTLNGATVTAFQNPSTSGGAVAITAAGQLTYTPPTGQTNISDTFTYTLSNSAGSATATVTVAVGARGFFVKNDVASTGSGSQASPFKTLLEATTAAAGVNGAQIVVFRGDGTATGQNVPVALSANQGIVAQDPANQPTISGPINLASNITLSNLRLVGTTGGDAVIGTGIAGATLSNLTIANTTVNGVNMTNPTGTLTMTGLSFSNIGRAAFPLSINAGTVTITASNWTATNTVGNVSEARISGNAVVSSTFDQMVFSNIGTTLTGTGFDWNSQNTSNATLTTSNLRFDGGLNGLFFNSLDSSSVAVIVSSSNITNCLTSRGIFLSAINASSLKVRLSNSRLTGNLFGFRASTGGTATLCARLTGNTSDGYEFLQGGGSGVLMVESLSTISTENVGASVPSGAVQDVAVGSCGIP